MRPLVLVLATCLLLAAEDPGPGAVTLLDGTTRSGAVSFPAGGTAVVVGGESLALADCDRIRLGGGGAPALAPARLGLWLSDGSWLPVTGIAAATEADAVAVSGPLGATVLPLASVRGWGEQALPAAEQDQVLLASGTYAGRVGGVSAGQLAFTSEGLGEVALPVAEVLALRLAGGDRPVKGLALSLAFDSVHPPLALLPGPTPRLAAAPSAVLTAWPPACELRVEGGRRVYLSALEPSAVREEGAFGVLWKHRRDANLDGGPILLDGARYARGVSLHSQCTIAWKLGGGYERLRTLVGIADEVADEGDCPVEILGDGKSLWRKERLTGRDRAQQLDLPLHGVQVLEVTVGFGQRYDIGDRVTLADAYLVRAKK